MPQMPFNPECCLTQPVDTLRCLDMKCRSPAIDARSGFIRLLHSILRQSLT